MRRLLIIIIFISSLSDVYSQNHFVYGITIDSITNYKIRNVRVSVFEKNKEINAFLTDSIGRFKIPVDLLTSNRHLEMHSFGYTSIVFKNKIPLDLVKNNFYLGEFRLVPKGINLQDIIIKKRKRYRDTTNIDLSDKIFERYIMIDDLFSKNLGFSKDNNGKLFYKGKPVANLLVNGGDFFGKNNTDIYKNLPALILNNIEVIETDIDSLTNTTLLNPTVKVNLKFKEKFNKGEFGNANLGIGTLERYIGAVDFYTYKKDEQISLSLNSNNLNVGDSFSEPRISFSGTSNNTVNYSSRITYRNLFYKKKIEVGIYIKPKINQMKFQSESDRKDEEFNQFSSTFNSSKTKAFSFEGTNINLTYKIDPQNVLKFTQTLDYENSRKLDSLNYFVNANNSLNISNLYKASGSVNETILSNLSYQKLSSKKRGRSFNNELIFGINKYKFNEENIVDNYSNNLAVKYFVDGQREAFKKQFASDSYFIEPFSESGYIGFLMNYKYESLHFQETLLSDSLDNGQNRNTLNYQYFSPGIKVFNRFNKLTLEGSVNGMLNFRDFDEGRKEALWNLDANFVFDHKITKDRNLLFHYLKKTNYPNVLQLTGINNSFDIISFSKGNTKLKPELQDRLEFTYDLKKTDSISLIFNANIEQYRSKIGFSINASPGETQTTIVENLGKAMNADISISLSKNFINGHNLVYRLLGNYQEQPISLNQVRQVSKSYGLSQSISSNLNIIKSTLSISPFISSTFSKYSYQNSNGNQINIVYTDKISLNYLKFEFSINPFLNFSYSISKNFSFATNAEMRRTFFRKSAAIWLKAYDVFNSYHYINNNISGSYVQTVKYSNIGRYLLIGASIKFNDMK